MNPRNRQLLATKRAEAWRQRALHHGLRGRVRRATARVRRPFHHKPRPSREQNVDRMEALLAEHSGSSRVHSRQCAEWFADRITT